MSSRALHSKKLHQNTFSIFSNPLIGYYKEGIINESQNHPFVVAGILSCLVMAASGLLAFSGYAKAQKFGSDEVSSI
jgi:hypothetical protein